MFKEGGENLRDTYIISWDLWGITRDAWRRKGFPSGSDSKQSACKLGEPGLVPGSERPLEKGGRVVLTLLAWKIPWMEEPGGLQSMGSQRVGHDWGINTHTHTEEREVLSEVKQKRESTGFNLKAGNAQGEPCWWCRHWNLCWQLTHRNHTPKQPLCSDTKSLEPLYSHSLSNDRISLQNPLSPYLKSQSLINFTFLPIKLSLFLQPIVYALLSLTQVALKYPSSLVSLPPESPPFHPSLLLIHSWQFVRGIALKCRQIFVTHFLNILLWLLSGKSPCSLLGMLSKFFLDLSMSRGI